MCVCVCSRVRVHVSDIHIRTCTSYIGHIVEEVSGTHWSRRPHTSTSLHRFPAKEQKCYHVSMCACYDCMRGVCACAYLQGLGAIGCIFTDSTLESSSTSRREVTPTLITISEIGCRSDSYRKDHERTS